MARKGETVVAVDFGARAVRVLIAEQMGDGSVRYRGDGSSPSRGCVRQGQIQNQSMAQKALRTALEEARKKAGTGLPSLFCGITAETVRSVIQEGRVPLESGVTELEHLDMARYNAEQASLNPGTRNICPVSSQEWYVDNTRVSEPLGIRGSVLLARLHFAQIPTVVEDNLRACVESQNRMVEDFVYTPIAAALGCLTPEDMQLGVAVVDLGHSGMGISVYRNLSIMGTATLDCGAAHIINDMSAGLKVPFDEAADILREYGVSKRSIMNLRQDADVEDTASAAAASEGTMVKLKNPVSGAPDRVPRKLVDLIVYERCNEIAENIAKFLRQHRLGPLLARGIVLTGGGANIHNFDLLLEAVCGINVRVGLPEGMDSMPQHFNAPENTPLVGIVRHGLDYRAAVRSGLIDQRGSVMGKKLRRVFKGIRETFF